MGGGRANGGQADAANNAAMQQSQASANLSNQYAKQAGQNYNYLFGEDGKSGSLSKFMDPSSLTATSLTGPYKTAYNQTTRDTAAGYDKARGSLAQQWANNGFAGGMPSGFQAGMDKELSRNQADAGGQNYTNYVGKQYNDSLNNFWNATNIASGQAASNTQAALQGSKDAASTDTSIYGTAGQYHQGAGAQILGSAMQAGGQVGAAAMCPAEGTLITLLDGSATPVESLTLGSPLKQEGGFGGLQHDAVPVLARCVRVTTATGRVTVVGQMHSFMLAARGYVWAFEALGSIVRLDGCDALITDVQDAGERKVYPLRMTGNHTYLCDGFWSLE